MVSVSETSVISFPTDAQTKREDSAFRITSNWRQQYAKAQWCVSIEGEMNLKDLADAGRMRTSKIQPGARKR